MSDIKLQCPECSYIVDYDDPEPVDGVEDVARCPLCGEISPVDAWFED